MGVPLRVGVRMFRTMTGPLSGVVHVISGLPRRRGARKGCRRAGAESRPSLAGPSDGGGIADGGSANTSNARSSGRPTGAGPADGNGDEPKRAPVPEEGLQPLKEMPGTPWALTKAVNERVQAVTVMAGLLKSKDEKVRLRTIELWLDLAYSKNSRPVEEERPQKISWNVPR